MDNTTMKKLSLMLVLVIAVGVSAVAKDIRTVVFKVEQMHCANCEAKVKKNIRFERGVKSLAIDLKKRTVTISYDAEKTTVKQLQEGFRKFSYEAVPFTAVRDSVSHTSR